MIPASISSTSFSSRRYCSSTSQGYRPGILSAIRCHLSDRPSSKSTSAASNTLFSSSLHGGDAAYPPPPPYMYSGRERKTREKRQGLSEGGKKINRRWDIWGDVPSITFIFFMYERRFLRAAAVDFFAVMSGEFRLSCANLLFVDLEGFSAKLNIRDAYLSLFERRMSLLVTCV